MPPRSRVGLPELGGPCNPSAILVVFPRRQVQSQDRCLMLWDGTASRKDEGFVVLWRVGHLPGLGAAPVGSWLAGGCPPRVYAAPPVLPFASTGAFGPGENFEGQPVTKPKEPRNQIWFSCGPQAHCVPFGKGTRGGGLVTNLPGDRPRTVRPFGSGTCGTGLA